MLALLLLVAAVALPAGCTTPERRAFFGLEPFPGQSKRPLTVHDKIDAAYEKFNFGLDVVGPLVKADIIKDPNVLRLIRTIVLQVNADLKMAREWADRQPGGEGPAVSNDLVVNFLIDRTLVAAGSLLDIGNQSAPVPARKESP